MTLVVAEYDEAIAFYRDRVGFELVEDTDLGEGRRWVVVAPPGDAPPAPALLLAKASGLHQLARIGDQTGGRVALFLMTDDLAADHARMTAAGVSFVEAPRQESLRDGRGLRGPLRDALGPDPAGVGDARWT